MNFSIEDNKVNFGVSTDKLEFTVKNRNADFTIDTDAETFSVREDSAIFNPDLSYSTGTSPIPAYTGSYTVNPSSTNEQTLNTGGYRMTDNVKVLKISYAETSNTYGTTISIAS